MLNPMTTVIQYIMIEEMLSNVSRVTYVSSVRKFYCKCKCMCNIKKKTTKNAKLFLNGKSK